MNKECKDVNHLDYWEDREELIEGTLMKTTLSLLKLRDKNIEVLSNIAKLENMIMRLEHIREAASKETYTMPVNKEWLNDLIKEMSQINL